MGRPEPCVLFSQTFVHPQLDEYVDEVIFAEPIVITACEFLEQNATSASSVVTLIGATSPPSFALEVFVQCEGETRFRRLCQPFLYSHSSSNVLEVEAVVTNHVVVRGSYRSLTLVIYGNTAEDLGQFNIEVDLDSTLTNTVSCIEGKLEDLPPALHPINVTIGDLIFMPKALSLEVPVSDISVEVKQLLDLTFKVLQLSNRGDVIDKVISMIVSAASSCATHSCYCPAISQKQSLVGKSTNYEGQSHFDYTEARNELFDIYNSLHHESGKLSSEYLGDSMLFEYEADLATSKQLMDILQKYIHFDGASGIFGHHQLSKNKSVILWLSAALLLCSGSESCFHFVNSGGMEQLGYIITHDVQNSHAITLMVLGVVEQATRHSIGCEGFLGWWPREDESIPLGTSVGYNELLKLLLQKQPHDVASLATHILHRLRFYEVASRYESSVLSALASLSTSGRVTNATVDKLTSARFQLKTLMKMINSRAPLEDPSPLASTSRSLLLGETEGVLLYKSTCSLITSSNCWFSNWDIDSHLLFLLKERGFFPLSAALLSSISQSQMGNAVDIFVDIASYLEAVILSLLFCRSGLIFLLHHPELSTNVILALRGSDGLKKEEPLPLRYASVLISKGFVCQPEEIGLIVEKHLRVVNAIDRLLTSDAHSEEILWVLWELCALSRSHCGRQALLALGHFPEAVSVLIAALQSIKELDPDTSNSGFVPLNLAVFHSAAEIFEVIVTDLTASSLGSWIGNATELHRALNSSSPGSNRKDAPTRLLEWVDASIVYHRKGATGLLQYIALLASGGDPHMASTSILLADTMDVENMVGDSSTSSDSNLIENLLGKPISENSYRAAVLRDSSVAQMTTAFRILAFISENSAVATALYDEGAVMVIHAVLLDCRLMLERSSNNYDYLVDEGSEGNSTSDLLLERTREQGLVDLVIPSLVLLVNLLQKLQDAKEQHRNTKLMKALLHLHREMSTRLASCAADLSSPYPCSALGLEAACHLLVSALACWPVYGWTPGLFSCLVDSLHATSLLALGPKEACCLLCLLNDLLPEEGFWLWKNGMPMLSALRTLAVGSLLGPQKEKQIGWYLQPEHLERVLSQLTPQLDKIGQIILQCAVSTLVVMQDMLRVFIIRIACLNADHACSLLRPIISWVRDRISVLSSLPDTDAYKVYRLLDFLSILLEHPRAKPLLLKEGAFQMLIKVLERCIAVADSDEKQFCDNRNIDKCGFPLLTWCAPVFKSFSLLNDSRKAVQALGIYDRHNYENLTTEDRSRIMSYLLKFCKVLPVGRELLACLSTFKELCFSSEWKSALHSLLLHIQSSRNEECDVDGRYERDGSDNLLNTFEWRKSPPLLCCWITLLRSLDSKDVVPDYAVEAVDALSSGALCFCMDGISLNLDRVSALKYLFGLPFNTSGADVFLEENIKYIEDLTNLLGSKISDEKYPTDTDMNSTLYQAKKLVESLLFLLQKPTHLLKVDDISYSAFLPSTSDAPGSSKMHMVADGSAGKAEDYSLGGLAEKFIWECPENLPDRLSQTALSLKRKISPLEGSNRRPRGDNSPGETVGQNTFSRGSGPPIVPAGPTRRDTFRQRKPNTSRPPSMHVDDYVARERSVDVTSSSNVIAVPRIGSSSGRPPSIHVDEFMARQRERQNPVGQVVGDATQVKNTPAESDASAEKSNSKPRQLKPDLDDDLQGIDIVFDGEESESDDKLPFPQPDDNLPQPESVAVEQNSPRSIVGETENDINGNSQFSHLGDESIQSEFSSRMLVSRPELTLTREPSISSDRKYYEPSDGTKHTPLSSSGFSPSLYNRTAGQSVQSPINSRVPPNLSSKNSPQQTGAVQGVYDLKFQPPLPPMPPPSTISPAQLKTADTASSQSSPFVNAGADGQGPPPPGFHVHTEYLSALSKSSTLLTTSRPPPPLPPTPPPYSASSTPPSKTSTSQSQLYNQTSIGPSDFVQTPVAPFKDPRTVTLSVSYPPPSLMPPLVFSRPNSMLYGTSPTPHQGENQPSISQNLSIPLPTFQPFQSLGQLQPLQPPQILRPPQPPQHLRPPVPPSPQSEQGVSLLQSPVQMQVHQQLQILQQPHVSPLHVYYQSPQQESFSHPQQQQQHQQQQVEHSQLQIMHQQGGTSQQQQDPMMSLQHFFSSPEAIQSLLSDREKLCQLLEEHPKLMGMLQEKLAGQSSSDT
ncbi:protein virilizer homolog isoform X2 [Rhododendron vialii]|uniref:protein virilizer homolog isoform X2 n=1 Tax=Rhododendron vialii TaxID=182163 RepID=UPI00265FC5E2|nr:protein virilizer homolog isoform X2 [Rhododendron vialii]